MKVIVIGGGVIGLCSAYSLARKGMDVTIVDPDDGPRTSLINGGMIVPSHIIPFAAPGMVGVGLRMLLRPKSPFWIRPRLDRDLIRWGLKFARSCTRENVERGKKLLLQLNGASKQGYLDFSREFEGFEVHQRGLLMVAKKEATLEEESHVAAQVRELGLPARVLNPHELADLDPGIRMDAAGGVHYPEDAHFSPAVFMRALRGKLDEMGVRFERQSAQRLIQGDNRVTGIETALGTRVADACVLAAGAWTSRLAAQIGLDMPLQAGKGYSFNVENPPERPEICAILMEGRVAVTPMDGGVRFAGTMEIGPPDERIDRRRVQGIRESVANSYPAFHGFDLAKWPVSVGLRPCTPDGLPYIGCTQRCSNVVVATGHAMMGMSLGPITGRLVAEIAAGEEPQIDLDILSPDRFAR